jgi:hypothetical protein
VKPKYLAGPMTGIAKFNFPAFEAAAKALRAAGYDITSPHENDTPEVQAAAWASPDGKLDATGKIAGETWGDILARDVKLVADEVSGVVLLTGWSKSRGARLEAFVAILCGLPFYSFEPSQNDPLVQMAPSDVLHVINHTTRNSL